LKPNDNGVKLGLARALVEDRQADADFDLGRQLVQQDKTYGPAYDFLYERYATTGRNDDAENSLKQRVCNNPKQAAFLLELARYYVLKRKPADVAGTLRKLTADRKDFPQGSLIAGDFYGSIGQAELALPQYEAGLSSTLDENNVYRKRIAAIMAVRRNWPEVYSQVQACLKDHPDDREAKLIGAVDHIERDGGQFSVLVLPKLGALSDEQCAAVRRFGARGVAPVGTTPGESSSSAEGSRASRRMFGGCLENGVAVRGNWAEFDVRSVLDHEVVAIE
jgi:tetratricopeptide (TPR) repeat protein